MLPFLRVTDYLRVLLLALTVATVTLLNQRQIAVLQQAPLAASQSGNENINKEENTRKTVVYQKVCFEATPGFAVPLPDMVAFLPLLFSFVFQAAGAPVLPLAGKVAGIPVALAGMLGSAILTRAP